MDAIDRVLDRIATALVWLGAVLVALMAVHVALDVLSRYLLNFPLPGTVEAVSHYYMVGAIFGPLAYVQARRGHFMAEIFTQWMPPRALAWLDALISLVMAAVLALIAWRTGLYAWDNTLAREHVQTAYFTVATWPPRWAVPAGLGLMALVSLVQAAKHLREGMR